MISIVVQEEESQKKTKFLTQYVNNLTLGSSSKNGNEKRKGKKFDKKKSFGPKKNDFKVKGKGKMKEGFKGECFYCKKSRHRIADCFKLKKKNEKEAGPSVSESSVAASVNTVVGHKRGKKPSMKHFRVWGCKAEVRPFNPQQKKLDLKTIIGYFIGYCTGSRGSRFYCPSHSTRVIESDRAFYFENDSDSESEAPRTIKLHNEDTLLIMPSIPSSSTTHVPTRAHDNIEVPIDVNPIDYVQDEQVIEPLINEVQEQVPEPVVNLKRNSSRTKHFDVKFLFVREKIDEAQTCIVHIPGEHMLADPLTKGVPVGVFKNNVTHIGVVNNFDVALV
ncbi:Retrovirus-related Pol polyprotein from transposon TNT 1-94 [Senna tora]|uniref:Retrovirus-related Pol polyprotein from transposon TNT 1-94 n=1 Tax=Senna tora TaxID=362788 RepID=A0A834WWA7_9FABA|nr:Retrovirus-related Pol polyprotein from transposon TNT 1-94 [Senna tora]